MKRPNLATVGRAIGIGAMLFALLVFVLLWWNSKRPVAPVFHGTHAADEEVAFWPPQHYARECAALCRAAMDRAGKPDCPMAIQRAHDAIASAFRLYPADAGYQSQITRLRAACSFVAMFDKHLVANDLSPDGVNAWKMSVSGIIDQAEKQ